jgi:hypothetical protein
MAEKVHKVGLVREYCFDKEGNISRISIAKVEKMGKKKRKTVRKRNMKKMWRVKI